MKLYLISLIDVDMGTVLKQLSLKIVDMWFENINLCFHFANMSSSRVLVWGNMPTGAN